jgi:hypothetical protein
MTDAETNYLPASRLAPIAAEHDEAVPVRRAEIERFAERVRELKNPIEAASAWAFTWLGLGIAAALSLLAMLGVQGQHVKQPVIWAHAAAIFIGFFLAAFCGWLDHRLRGDGSDNNESVACEIEKLNERAPSAPAAETAEPA